MKRPFTFSVPKRLKSFSSQKQILLWLTDVLGARMPCVASFGFSSLDVLSLFHSLHPQHVICDLTQHTALIWKSPLYLDLRFIGSLTLCAVIKVCVFCFVFFSCGTERTQNTHYDGLINLQLQTSGESSRARLWFNASHKALIVIIE